MSKSTKEILESYRLDKLYLEELTNDKLLLEDQNNDGSTLTFKNLDKLLKELSYKITKIENIIDSLPQPHKNILYYKYIKNLSHNKIAMKMDYSLQRIFQLQKEALYIFSKKFNDK